MAVTLKVAPPVAVGVPLIVKVPPLMLAVSPAGKERVAGLVLRLSVPLPPLAVMLWL